MSLTRFSSRILLWYAENGRRLPWRGGTRPYEIWVAEVMLQQTRVETVAPYFHRWMRAFPSVRALARAPERRVLKLWEGLGYYSRARNLHRAAKILVDQHRGRLPPEAGRLIQLPGIGKYTAAAISSIAFGRDEPTLDGNIRRVLARAFEIEVLVDSPAGEQALMQVAWENLPAGRAGDYNQAIMDLGAVVCLPRAPRCGLCPIRGICKAHRSGREESLPLLRKRNPIPHYRAAAAVIKSRGRVLLAHRPPTGLLAGMWEFPSVRLTTARVPRADHLRGFAGALRREYGLKVSKGPVVGTIEHAYTHFSVTVRVYACELASSQNDARLRWIRPRELRTYPMGRVDRQIASQIDGSSGRATHGTK